MSLPSVLVVTPVFTHPPTQGNAARILAFGRELKARGFRVEVVHYALDRLTPEGDQAMRREWDAVYHLDARPHKPQNHPMYWGLDDWCPDEVCNFVGELCRSKNYVAVVVNYVWMSRCLEGLVGPIKIIDTHDIFSDRHKVSADHGIEPNWFFTSPIEEARGFARADIVIGIQKLEAEYIATQTAALVLVVGHPIPNSFLSFERSAYQATDFGYFASGNPWNLASLRQFDVHLARNYADCDWSVAGTICDVLPRLETSPFIFGKVDQPLDFYRHVRCCVNPMLAGTGLKVKTIEAISHGVPVIGTKVAFEGLGAFHRMHRLSDMDEVVLAVKEYGRYEAVERELSIASMQLLASYNAEVMRQYDDLSRLIVFG
ncbi:glycosyltransferase [Bosea beijingensis]